MDWKNSGMQRLGMKMCRTTSSAQSISIIPRRIRACWRSSDSARVMRVFTSVWRSSDRMTTGKRAVCWVSRPPWQVHVRSHQKIRENIVSLHQWNTKLHSTKQKSTFSTIFSAENFLKIDSIFSKKSFMKFSLEYLDILNQHLFFRFWSWKRGEMFSSSI